MAKRPSPQSKSAVDVDQLLGRLRLSHVFNWVLGALVIILAAVLIFRGVPDQNAELADTPPVVAGADQDQDLEVSEQVDQAGEADPQTQAQEEDQELSHIRAQEGDQLAVGSMDAPVVISEWADYRCPYCALFAQETLPTLLADYVESGKVRIEFNDVYYFGDDSYDAAVAARAAAEQGRYLEFIEALYAAAPEKGGHPDMPREVLVGFAKEAGVPDMEKFETDLDSDQLKADVEASHQQAVNWGISSVPFFVVGDQAVSGAQPLEVFAQLIEQYQN